MGMRRRRARQRRWWGDRWQAKDKGRDRLKSHKQPITAAALKEAEME